MVDLDEMFDGGKSGRLSKDQQDALRLHQTKVKMMMCGLHRIDSEARRTTTKGKESK